MSAGIAGRARSRPAPLWWWERGTRERDVANDLAETHAVVLSYGARRPAPPSSFRSVWAWRVTRWRDTRMPRGVPGPFEWPFKPGMFEAADLRRFERTGRRVGRAVGADRDELLLDDGSRIRANTVIWATGYDLGLEWIATPGHPRTHVISARFLFGLPHRAAAVARRIHRGKL